MELEINILNVSLILIVFVLTYIGIIHSKIDKTTSAVFGGLIAAILVLMLKMEDPTHPGVEIDKEHIIHFRDLEVIGLILGFLMLVDVASESGIFHYLAIKILKLSKGDPIRLERYFGLLSVVLSVLVGNISAMMIVGSLTLIACERLELPPKPYIVVELSMTTVGGIITLVASIPNIIISQIFGIGFISFFIIGAPWGIITMFVNFLIFERLYRNEFKLKISPKELERRVNEFDEWVAVKDKKHFYLSAVVLIISIIGFIISDQLGLPLALIAITAGMTISIANSKKIEDVLSNVDWSLISFFMGLFVLISTLDLLGVMEVTANWMASILPDNPLAAATIILWFVSIISAIVDNIVVAAAFGPILYSVAKVNPSFHPTVIAWATIFGASFGGGLTPIGAPSAVIGLTMLKRKTGEKMGWGEFIKTQGLATLIRIIITTGYLAILIALNPV
ncbi:MAG: anion permease [Candidatus Heimdallarchaeota archaeon]|nr:anion permease [Candidatus Heimdallarchaeota archaeon]